MRGAGCLPPSRQVSRVSSKVTVTTHTSARKVREEWSCQRDSAKFHDSQCTLDTMLHTSDPGTEARLGRPNLYFSKAARRQPKVGTDQATKIQDVENKGRYEIDIAVTVLGSEDVVAGRPPQYGEQATNLCCT